MRSLQSLVVWSLFSINAALPGYLIWGVIVKRKKKKIIIIIIKTGYNCIQYFHLGWWYIVGYTVGNLVLHRRVSRAKKRDYRLYIRRYASTNENFPSKRQWKCSMLRLQPVAASHLPGNETWRCIMTWSLRQYIAWYTVRMIRKCQNYTTAAWGRATEHQQSQDVMTN